MNFNKATLGQLLYLARYTDAKVAAQEELLRRIDIDD